MNANELADELERPNNYQQENNFTTQAATMLRQQQQLIDILNGRIERMIEKQSHYESMAHAGGFEASRELGMKQERERNNEPVAWMDEETGCFVYSQYDYEDLDEHGKDGLIPLYTHPVKEQDTDCQYCKQGCFRCDARKQLTDEEIKQIFQEQTGFYFDDNPADDLALMDFARAILRKAQEK